MDGVVTLQPGEANPKPVALGDRGEALRPQVDPWAQDLAVLEPRAGLPDPWAPAESDESNIDLILSHLWELSGVPREDVPVLSLAASAREPGSVESALANPAPSTAAWPVDFDPWEPAGLCRKAATPVENLEPALRDDILLPFCRADRRVAWFDPAVFAVPFQQSALAKAKRILDIAPPFSTRFGKILLARFEGIFRVRSDARFFRTMQKLADECEDADLLSRAVAVRDLWGETPEFWLMRRGRSAVVLQGSGAGTLGWNEALQIAACRCDYPADAVINTDWVDRWRRLQSGEEGFPSFAKFAALCALEEGGQDLGDTWRSEDRSQELTPTFVQGDLFLSDKKRIGTDGVFPHSSGVAAFDKPGG